MKRICILGSTGSIGTQALEVIENNKEHFRVTVLSCGTRIEELSAQIIKFNPEIAVVAKAEDAAILTKRHPETEILYGMDGLIEAAESDCDMVLNALVGMLGLQPTYRAILKGTTIALANKETLVAGGKLITEAARKNKVRILPVDSEHSAIFQCLQGNQENEIKKVILTASGGPFRNYSLQDLEKVTREQALKHPKWTMGQKITIDSATMMNKGLEVIEASWLYHLSGEKIKIAVHPQSIVHSMVEYMDNSIIAQLGLPDMKIPISYAFSYPERLEMKSTGLDIFKDGANLTFEKLDQSVFKCAGYAYEALKKGGSYSAALNGANEMLVQLFLEGKIRFVDIQNILGEVLEKHESVETSDIDHILEIDLETRVLSKKLALNI
ncbi:MAG: 1-deoxy-D-xylulose-5-phosphate reductoisomerase [Peptostreptococcaceae bacterium]|nr:1-deoxy-D-xylulose-5-phosphate reductoisomerase [Peptostreptococcaceae bacterium]